MCGGSRSSKIGVGSIVSENGVQGGGSFRVFFIFMLYLCELVFRGLFPIQLKNFNVFKHGQIVFDSWL